MEGLLEAQVSEGDIAKIAREYLNRWNELAPFLGLTEGQETEVQNSSSDYGDQKRAALLKWRAVKGRAATYAAFIAAANEAGLANLADNVRDLLRSRLQQPALQPSRQQRIPAPELTTRDLLTITGYLTPLQKSQIKTLGLLLGLYDVTVRDTYEGTARSDYLDTVVTAWLNKQDSVDQKGGPHWTVLVAALQSDHLRHNGIAAKIRAEQNL